MQVLEVPAIPDPVAASTLDPVAVHIRVREVVLTLALAEGPTLDPVAVHTLVLMVGPILVRVVLATLAPVVCLMTNGTAPPLTASGMKKLEMNEIV